MAKFFQVFWILGLAKNLHRAHILKVCAGKSSPVSIYKEGNESCWAKEKIKGAGKHS